MRYFCVRVYINDLRPGSHTFRCKTLFYLHSEATSDKYNSLRLKDELEENLFPLNQGVSARRSANWNNV